MNILCTICMRKGSKGVKNKNMRKINGNPLLSYTIKQAVNSKLFKRVVVSTDSKIIGDISKKYGAEFFFIRSNKLATDNSAKILSIRDTLFKTEKKYNEFYDIIIDLDVTSPLRNINDIKLALNKFLIKKSSLLFSVTKSKKNPYFNMVHKKNNKFIKVKNSGIINSRQKSPLIYDMNASIYIWKRDTLIKKNNLFINNNEIYEMPENRSIDIDSEFDFKLIKLLLKNK